MQDELRERFESAAGVEVATTRQPAMPVVVLLLPGALQCATLVAEWMELFASNDESVRILPLFSTAVPFSMYLAGCPDELAVRGFFDILFAKWPLSAALQDAAVGFAMSPLRTPVSAEVETQAAWAIHSYVFQFTTRLP